MRSLTRRSFVQHDAVLRCGELSFDTVKRAAQAKGYTLEEIVDLFKADGAQISLSSVKSALKGSSPRSRTTKPAQAGEQTAPQAASNAQPDGSHNGG